MILMLTPSLRLRVLGSAANRNQEFIFYPTFKSSLPVHSRLLELTQKMAMLQEEPVIVKPMPGRPSAQNPPRRGGEHFQRAAICSCGAECIRYFLFLCAMSYDLLEMIPGTYCEEKSGPKAVTADCRLQVP